MKFRIIIILLLLFVCFGFSMNTFYHKKTSKKMEKPRAKFEPANGECLFFIGQDLEAIGGLENYTDGYCDYFDIPAGVTFYTGFSPGIESYGYFQKGNDGIRTVASWGAGDNCAQYYLEDKKFNNSAFAIGLSFVNNEKKVAKGKHDDLIKELGNWIIETKRPVFLRIGYEFDGWGWNNYNKKYYLAAWKRIHSIFAEMKIDNVAFVWQSKGTGSSQKILEEWYPGDDLVDWCGYSYFSDPDEEMLTFARRHKKPVFIAEATPVLSNGSLFFDTDLTKPEISNRAWENWYVPFLKTINENKDVIKAFSYINVNWKEQPMWVNNSVFKKVDSRIQVSDFISKKWKEEVSKSRYLKPTSELFKKLNNK